MVVSPAAAAPLMDGTVVTLTPIYASGAIQPTLTAPESAAVEFSNIPNYNTSVDISNNFLTLTYLVTGHFLGSNSNFNGFEIKAQGYNFETVSQSSGVPLANTSISADGSTLLINVAGISFKPGQSSQISFSAVATAAAVPEPATWAMMILGMGAIGYTMRRRQSVRVSYAA